jgi:hypothetical protein
VPRRDGGEGVVSREVPGRWRGKAKAVAVHKDCSGFFYLPAKHVTEKRKDSF